MINESTKLFGDISQFAIEIKPYKIPEKFYLRLWFRDISFGDFKKAGSLDYMVNSYFKLVGNINNLYEVKFDKISDRRIFEDIFYDLTIERSAEEQNKLYERQQMLAFEFGENQLNNFTFILLSLREERQIKVLIYEMDGDNTPKLHSFTIEETYFFSVYKEFMRYVEMNDLKKRKPFFPKSFSYKDIS